MALTPQELATTTVFQRFGLGARGASVDAHVIDSIAADPKAALLAELTTVTEPAAFHDIQTTPTLLSGLARYRMAQREARRVTGQPDAGAIKNTAGLPPPEMPVTGRAQMDGNPVQAAVRAEIDARFAQALRAPIGFKERLVLFWANHFTVAGINPRVRVVCGAFEREAIRPHLTGSFEDMLVAVESHPAMLMYLDNAQSFGPRSQAGQRRAKGLNENLAREILELHTVGVDGGYSQGDVTRFAEVLTGWSVVGPQAARNGLGGEPGAFVFRPQMHEPGPRAVMGQTYAGQGFDQGRAVLHDLAARPQTALHIATKLCRHFIADQPPKAAIDQVARAFVTSNGSLMAVYAALLSAPEAWTSPARKLRTPYEFVVATSRALAMEPKFGALMRSLALMGHTPFQAPSPKGWPDETAAWIAPDAFKTRIDFAELAARRATAVSPQDLARAVLGAALTDETQTMIRHAESPQQALTLLLMAPEFQRR